MRVYTPEQSQDDFGKDSIIFSSSGVSHLSSQPSVNNHLPEERKGKSHFSSSMLWNSRNHTSLQYSSLRVEKNAQKNLPFIASLILKLTSVIFSKLTA